MSEPSAIEIDRWRLGFPLETAWSAFAERQEKQRYHRIATDEHQRWVQYLQMVAELWQRISAGELIACGWRVAPSESASPVMIPAAMFDSPPLKEDLDIGRFRFHSWCFESVKVLPPLSNSTKKEGRLDSKVVQQAQRGRPRHDLKLCSATQHAAEGDPLLLTRSAEKQIGIIKEAAAKLYPGKFANEDGPGRSTIARYVKRQRETGWPDLLHPEIPKSRNSLSDYRQS